MGAGGCSRLAERMGDAQAFALVKEHFRTMERIVAENGGGIMASEAVFAQGEGTDYLRERSWKGDSFVTSLKGLKASYQVQRIYRPRPQEIETPAPR